MNKKLIFAIILTFLVLSACQSQTEQAPTVDHEAFEIYLVAESQIRGTDLQNYTLEELTLAEEPIITAEDMLQYTWETHTFDLDDESYSEMLALFRNMPMTGVPFVLVSNGERIYAGAFWSLASSLSFDGVTILQPLDPSGGSFFITLGYPSREFFSGTDPREHSALKQALEESGLLDE